MVGFFGLIWIALVSILILAPEVYMQTLTRAGMESYAVLIAPSFLIALLVVGVFRRWRWTFWVVLIAFFFGALRIPVSALQIAGMIPASGPTWYEALQAVIGAGQLMVAIAMFTGYRRAGI